MSDNFQGDATKQGKMFEQSCIVALEAHNFCVRGHCIRLEDVGIQIDIHAENYHGVSMWFECKGSLKGDRQGTKRTDTMKKAIANAYLFTLSGEYSCCSPMMIFASHVPEKGQGLSMILAVPRTTVYDVLNPWNDSARLRWLYHATPEVLEADIERQSLCDILVNRWRIHCNGHTNGVG